MFSLLYLFLSLSLSLFLSLFLSLLLSLSLHLLVWYQKQYSIINSSSIIQLVESNYSSHLNFTDHALKYRHFLSFGSECFRMKENVDFCFHCEASASECFICQVNLCETRLSILFEKCQLDTACLLKWRFGNLYFHLYFRFSINYETFTLKFEVEIYRFTNKSCRRVVLLWKCPVIYSWYTIAIISRNYEANASEEILSPVMRELID